MPHRRVQYAALPYRQRQDGEVQVRLITSRETRRWVIPKGWPMKGLAPHKAAAREAFEEAGLLGSTARNAIGMYTYEKRLSPMRSLTCDVMVFPMRVKRYLKKWPERSQRIGFWFTIESAAAAVQEEELRDLILRFGAAMAARYAEAQAAKAAGPDTLEEVASVGEAEAPARAPAEVKSRSKAKSPAKAKSKAKAAPALTADAVPGADAAPDTGKTPAKPKASKAKAPKEKAAAKAPAKEKAPAKDKGPAKGGAKGTAKGTAKGKSGGKDKEKSPGVDPAALAPVLAKKKGKRPGNVTLH